MLAIDLRSIYPLLYIQAPAVVTRSAALHKYPPFFLLET